MSTLRNAARALVRAPAIAISGVLCIALGVGATTAISSAIDRALLQPLPFPDPERLVTVYRTTPHFDNGPFSAPNYSDLARTTRRLEQLAAVTPTTALLALPEEAAQITVNRATGNLFPMLGARALRGRLLTAADDDRGAEPVVVLGAELWRERFGGDPALVGRTITLDGRAHTVLGVLPANFRVPHGGQLLRADAWVPMRFTDGEMERRRSNFIVTMGRLARGSSVQSAAAELRQLFDGIVETYPELRGESVRVLPLQAEGVRAVRTPLLLLFGAVCIVLLIASTNVASLLLARGVQRRREIAIRAALGGSRWNVVRPVLAESALIIATGLALGLFLAWIGVRTIGALAAQRIPHLAGLSIDFRIVAFAVALSVIVGALCAAMPAWRSAAVDPQEALRAGRGGGPGQEHHRALGALVVAEVAMSLVLLIGAGLVLKGFARLMHNDPGFDPDPVLTLKATVSADRYPDATSVRRFLEPALAEIRAVGGVQEAASISLLPYDNWGWNSNMRYEGQTGGDPTQLPLVENRVVTPEFFRVTSQRLIAGRLLTDGDDERPGAPVVVVANEALVKRDFRDRDPIGKRFHTGDTTFATIVGVVTDIRNFGPVQDPRPEVYWSYRQSGPVGSTFPIMVRVKRGEAAAVAPGVRAAIRRVDPGAAVTELQPMREVIAGSVGKPRFYVSLLGVFAAVALVLAVSGIYGVMSYAVAQRTREFGIRTALGSTTARTARLVTGQALGLIGAGVVLGLGGGFVVTRLLQSLLYGVSPLDVSTWSLAILSLAAAGVLATLMPALRATRVDPIVAMREE